MRAYFFFGLAVSSVVACGPVGQFATPPVEDSGSEGDAAPTFEDASIPNVDAAPALTTSFFLLATETPAQPTPDGSNWGGVERFNVSANYAAAVPVTGLPKSTSAPLLINDPLGLAFRWTSAELFVTNRGGNLTGQSSITKFPYDAATQTFGAGSIVVSGYDGFHQLAFNHTEDEMFLGTFDEGLRRFKLTSGVWVEELPQLVSSGFIRGVAASPDDKMLYASTASNIIRQFDLTTNTELPEITLPGQLGLHFMTVCGLPTGNLTMGCSPAQLYVSDATDNSMSAVYRFDIDPTDDSLQNQTIIPAAATFATALSPEGKELFSGESTGNNIQRFLPGGGSWSAEPKLVPTNNNIGTIPHFPDERRPDRAELRCPMAFAIHCNSPSDRHARNVPVMRTLPFLAIAILSTAACGSSSPSVTPDAGPVSMPMTVGVNINDSIPRTLTTSCPLPQAFYDGLGRVEHRPRRSSHSGLRAHLRQRPEPHALDRRHPSTRPTSLPSSLAWSRVTSRRLSRSGDTDTTVRELLVAQGIYGNRSAYVVSRYDQAITVDAAAQPLLAALQQWYNAPDVPGRHERPPPSWRIAAGGRRCAGRRTCRRTRKRPRASHPRPPRSCRLA